MWPTVKQKELKESKDYFGSNKSLKVTFVHLAVKDLLTFLTFIIEFN